MATAPTAPAPSPARDERLARVNIVSRLVARPDIGALCGAVAVFFLFAWTARNVHWLSDFAIWSQWMDQSAQYGIVAVPVALLMIGGEFDLSAGVMIGSSGLLLGLLTTRADWNIWPAIAVVLLFGMAIGFINGYTVVKTKLPSFIVTLGTFFILQGVNAGGTLKITGTVAINGIDAAPGFDSARPFFASSFWSPYDFKVNVLWWIGLTVVGAWLLARTRFGNWIYAVGGDPVAARNVGVPVARTKIALFMMTSTTAALARHHHGHRPARDPGQRGRRARVHLHHRGRRRRLPADRRLRLRGGRGLRCRHPRHGEHRDHPLAVGQQLGVRVPGHDPRARGHAQRRHPRTGSRGEVEMSEPGGHLLEARELSKYYGNVVALRDISASVDAGEVTCVLGDNGAGKSSFIKILSGAHRPDDGPTAGRWPGGGIPVPARRARPRHRDRLPGPRDGARSCRSGATSSSEPSRRRASGR